MPYIIESNMRILPVRVLKSDREFAIVSILENRSSFDFASAIRVRKGRIYKTEEEAWQHLPTYLKLRHESAGTDYQKTHWDYDDERSAQWYQRQQERLLRSARAALW